MIEICLLLIVLILALLIARGRIISGGGQSRADEIYDIISSDKYCKLSEKERGRPLIDQKMTIFGTWHIFGAPTRECISQLGKFLNKHAAGIISLGAGTGAVEYILAEKLQIPLYATDIGIKNTPRGNKNYKQWMPVDTLDYDDEAALRGYIAGKKIDAVLLSWPEMSFKLRPLKIIAPKYIIYIGEGPGGCNGTDALFKYFSRMDEIKISYCAWGHVHDYCRIYVKK